MFSKRTAAVIDSSEKRNGWLNFQLQSPHVIERRSNGIIVPHFVFGHRFTQSIILTTAKLRIPFSQQSIISPWEGKAAIVGSTIERFHSCGQQLCKFIGTKESFYIRKEFNSYRIGLGHQHGCHFIVLGHQ